MPKRPQTSAYRKIDIHALGRSCGVDLDQAFANLAKLYSDLDARLAQTTQNLNLPCRRGCDACCYDAVFLTQLEFLYVWDWAQNNLPHATLDAAVSDALVLYQKHVSVMEALRKPTKPGEPDHGTLVADLSYRCPLLGPEGGCQVYPVREMLARLYGASFFSEGGVYGCHLSGEALAGQTVQLLPARQNARRILDLPLTDGRLLYLHHIFDLYGADSADNADGADGTDSTDSTDSADAANISP